MDYAHSANHCGRWHPLREHLTDVSRLATEFARYFSWREEATLAGLLHDLGKYGGRFQARLRGEDQGLDHWSQGAWIALTEHRSVAAALAIQGHHIGLQHLEKNSLLRLEPQRLATRHPLQLALSEADPMRLKAQLEGDGLAAHTPKTTICESSTESRIDRMLDIRMLFSALVDADFLDTEAHFQGDANGKRIRPAGPALKPEKALEILLEHLSDLGENTRSADKLAAVRASLRSHCLDAGGQGRGLFTLTAPTGSGKTLSMLVFALAHARRHGLRRIVIVIPYLSIIEQTAAIYRNLFARHFGADYVLEHHSLAGLGEETAGTDAEGRGNGESPEQRRRKLAENWDAPIVVTTSVQLLESLFSNRPSACRKLHRLAESVILFDEVQTLPANLAVPTLAALSHLAHACASSVVFSTATQPAFEHLHYAVGEHCANGWQPRAIVPEPLHLFAPLKRVEVVWRDPNHGVDWESLADELRDEQQVLCIVNLKRHAEALWEKLQQDGALHLSTQLCPAHRATVLRTVRDKLAAADTVRLIATQCIEAGVDVDFPSVYRAYGPLDAIIQAAGRCNREGRMAHRGRVQVFMPEDEGYPRGSGYEQAAQITKMLLNQLGAENLKLDDPDFITGYYRLLYDISKPEAAKKAQELIDLVHAGAFPEVAKAYRLIEQDTINIVVPYEPLAGVYQALRARASSEGLSRDWIKLARPLTVSLFRPKLDDPVWDALSPVQQFRAGRRAIQEDWYIALRPEHYHSQLGFAPPASLNLWIA